MSSRKRRRENSLSHPLNDAVMICKRGGEEILKYDGVSLNAGKGLDPKTGIFVCPQVCTSIIIHAD